jgi:hypothetical protein
MPLQLASFVFSMAVASHTNGTGPKPCAYLVRGCLCKYQKRPTTGQKRPTICGLLRNLVPTLCVCIIAHLGPLSLSLSLSLSPLLSLSLCMCVCVNFRAGLDWTACNILASARVSHLRSVTWQGQPIPSVPLGCSIHVINAQ